MYTFRPETPIFQALSGIVRGGREGKGRGGHKKKKKNKKLVHKALPREMPLK